MTSREQIQWYNTFNRFRLSRIKTWAPKIYKAYISVIHKAVSEPFIQQAINKLGTNIDLAPLSQVILNMYIDAGRVMGAKAYQMVKKQSRVSVKQLMPIGFNEDLVNEIIQYLRVHNLQMVMEITNTMKAWILKQLVEAQQQGKSIEMVRDEIVKEGFPKNRAILIARTETLKAANYGQIQGAKKTGYKMNKTWLSTRDARTRRIPRDGYNHLAMNGITIPLDELFQVPRKDGGYDSLQQPGDPNGEAGDIIQCRCTISFEVLRDANGRPIKI